MAATSYGVNDNETVKLWGRKLFRESLKSTSVFRFMGRTSDSLIQILDDTSKGPGDRVRNILRMQLSGDGIQGDSTLEGNEEELTTFTDDLVIDQLRHAVKSNGKMSEQRIPFSVRNEARLALQDWWSDRIDTWVMNQIAGKSDIADVKLTGLQSVSAPDTDHHIFSTGSDEDAVSASSASTMTLNLIDVAVEKARTLSPAIRPLKIQGEDHYVMFLHPYQVTDLRRATSSGDWADIQKAALQGGQVTNNPIFTGALGKFNNVILHQNTRVPEGQSSVIRRAVFCGAQTAVMATGRDNSEDQMTWVEELFDYSNALGVSAGMIAGVKKSRFDSKDFGSIVVSTYAAAHTQ